MSKGAEHFDETYRNVSIESSNTSGGDKLPFHIKKEIWHKLMELGVLGTISFESANDNYLIQVYKLFYPGTSVKSLYYRGNSTASSGSSALSDVNSQHVSNSSWNPLMRQSTLASARSGGIDNDPMDVDEENPFPFTSESEDDGVNFNENEPSEGEEVQTNTSELEEGDGSDEDESDDRESAMVSENDSDITSRILNAHHRLHSAREKTDLVNKKKSASANPPGLVKFYSYSGSHEKPLKLKKNGVAPDIYRIIGYFLPNQWNPPPNNSLSVTSDGVMNLAPNPNYQKTVTEESTTGSGTPASIVRNRLRNTITGNLQSGNRSKSDYLTACANNVIPSSKVSIFYYEIRVLTVTSSLNAQNSNIIVGFKYAPPSRESSNSVFDSIPSRPTSNRTRSDPSSRNNEASVRTGSRGSQLSPNESHDDDDDDGNDDDDLDDDSDDGNDIEGLGEENVDTATINALIVGALGGVVNADGDDSNTNLGMGIDKSRGNKDGLEDGFFGYCGDDGFICVGTESKKYSQMFGRDDIIGCGINYIDGTIFFTKNGVFLGTAFTNVYDLNVVPSIALKPGNSVRTNFGIYEEFVFDIGNYQNNWKNKSLNKIFKSLDYDFDCKDGNTTENNQKASFLLGKDDRIDDMNIKKPNSIRLNDLNVNNDSIPNTLNVMINDYLLHEGMVDLAKSFLKDLRNDCIEDDIGDNVGNANMNDMKQVIDYNDKQIQKEETLVYIRQEIRRLVLERNIEECIKWINLQLPGLLESDMELLFEMKLCQYLITIIESSKTKDDKCINDLLRTGQGLYNQFVYNEQIDGALRESFQFQLNNVSSLLAYDDPINEVTGDLSIYVSNEYLEGRLFQIINSKVLQFLNKRSDCSLEDMVVYTRAMLSTMMNYKVGGEIIDKNGGECRYYKAINIDEDFLNL